MWLALAFAALGFLTGQLIGLSASSTVKGFLALLFALIGGSAVAFVRNVDPADRVIASRGVLLLCIGCLGGLYLAMIETKYCWLVPPQMCSTEAPAPSKPSKPPAKPAPQAYWSPYPLKAHAVSKAREIDLRKTSGDTKTARALEELFAVAHQQNADAVEIEQHYRRQEIDAEIAYDKLFKLITGQE